MKDDKPRSLRVKRLSIMGFAMIIVLLPFGLYYVLFVSSQINYFTNRNFRVLAEIGNHISIPAIMPGRQI